MSEIVYRGIMANLHLLTEAEMRQLNKEVVQRIRSKMRVNAAEAMQELHPGQWVKFNARGRWWYGTVKTLNSKTVTVDTPDQGRGWRVAPSNLIPMTTMEIATWRDKMFPPVRSKVAVG